MVLRLFCNQVTAVRFCHGAPLLRVNAKDEAIPTVREENRFVHVVQYMEMITDAEGNLKAETK
jgi:hypothetical protein